MRTLQQIANEVALLQRDYPDLLTDLAAEKWVRVMCDYSAEGVWAKDGGAIGPEALPIDLSLMARIHAWQDVYETIEPWDTPAPAGLVESFAVEGLAIAIAMKRQLPGWTVVYHDERRSAPRPKPDELAAILATLEKSGRSEKSFDASMIFLERYRPWFAYEITDDVVIFGVPPDNYPK